MPEKSALSGGNLVPNNPKGMSHVKQTHYFGSDSFCWKRLENFKMHQDNDAWWYIMDDPASATW